LSIIIIIFFYLISNIRLGCYNNASNSFSSSESDEEANLCMMANHESSDNGVRSSSNDNDYNSLYDAFQQLLCKSSKLDVALKKN